jgi:hypothetical protein
MAVEETGLLGCCTVGAGNGFPKYLRNLPPLSSGYEHYESIPGLLSLKKQAACSYETSAVNYPTTRRKKLHPHYKDSFVTKRSPPALYHFLWVSGNFSAALVVSFAAVFFLFFACYTSDKKYTHTHTHTHTHTQVCPSNGKV